MDKKVFFDQIEPEAFAVKMAEMIAEGDPVTNPEYEVVTTSGVQPGTSRWTIIFGPTVDDERIAICGEEGQESKFYVAGSQ